MLAPDGCSRTDILFIGFTGFLGMTSRDLSTVMNEVASQLRADKKADVSFSCRAYKGRCSLHIGHDLSTQGLASILTDIFSHKVTCARDFRFDGLDVIIRENPHKGWTISDHEILVLNRK